MPVAKADGDNGYSSCVSVNLTTKEMTHNKTTEPTATVPNPKLPKRLCTNISPMPTKPDVLAPPSLKIVVMNAKKKIPKKKSQSNTVAELAKRRDDLLNCVNTALLPQYVP